MIDWSQYLPKDFDVQVSKNQDMEACASYSAIHLIEMLLKYKTGFFWEWSERALAKLSDTQPWGNTIENVINALNQYGLILTSDWPELLYSTDYVDINWATYYAAIPQSVLKRAYRVKVNVTKISPGQVPNALNTAPVWTIIKTAGLLHLVTQISQTQFYDSYEIKVKNFSDGYPIQSQYAFNINFLNMPNSYIIQVNKKDGTKEIAIALPAIDGGCLIDKGLNTGLPIPTVNNDGKTVDWPNLPIRYQVNEQ